MPFRFESLEIWNKARAYAAKVYVVSASFLACDRGYITDQERQELYDDGERLAKSINAFRNSLR